jgi:hypothetical protein
VRFVSQICTFSADSRVLRKILFILFILSKKRSELSEIIMEINDLREFGRPRLLRRQSRAEEKRQSAIATQGTQGTQRTKGKNPLSLCPFAAFGGQFISGFPWPLSPLQTFKEQARERLTYSTLP